MTNEGRAEETFARRQGCDGVVPRLEGDEEDFGGRHGRREAPVEVVESKDESLGEKSVFAESARGLARKDSPASKTSQASRKLGHSSGIQSPKDKCTRLPFPQSQAQSQARSIAGSSFANSNF